MCWLLSISELFTNWKTLHNKNGEEMKRILLIVVLSLFGVSNLYAAGSVGSSSFVDDGRFLITTAFTADASDHTIPDWTKTNDTNLKMLNGIVTSFYVQFSAVTPPNTLTITCSDGQGNAKIVGTLTASGDLLDQKNPVQIFGPVSCVFTGNTTNSAAWTITIGRIKN